MDTSRHWVLDGVEMVGQLLALNSHLQEIADSFGENDKISIEEYDACKVMIESNNITRRGLMDKMKSELSDHKRWCCVKHSIFAYELACEIMYANKGDEEIQIYQYTCMKNMYNILSRFLGVEVTMCGRCLNDSLQETGIKVLPLLIDNEGN